MNWGNTKISLQESAKYSSVIEPEWSAAGDSIKGLLLGMSAAPLLLVSVYFFKASPRFFSREHGISLLAYISSSFLAALGVILYGLPIVITSFQILPMLNQVFVASFTFSLQSAGAIFLTVLSIYFSMVGYQKSEQTSSVSWLSLVLFLAVLALAILKLTMHGERVGRHLSLEKLSDLMCMLVLSAESAIGFGALCAFAYIFNLFLPAVALITSMSFLLAMEKALYYYPATAVIPVFTVFLRVFGAIFSMQMFTNAFNPAVALSLILGAISSLFPLILA
ncbi:uncharacterized protein NEMAJ01_1001 [Nematocida major]|uniref:uncharacterized protein n=1 Tax=Nematocida major TaxID=1912982 RepID=UPI002008E524|nr:uncharacterized protein NEMAJ01_1001 [Nematocida major]KAH9386105.1 hypothetical protein NEMAJ01_1001 [Nematocida major]